MHGRHGLTADTALRFAKFFGTTVAFWMKLQEEYDLRKTEYSIKKELSKITRFEFSQSLA